mgnify:FL=1
MDGKLAIGFLADILYLKGIICFDEFEDIQNAKNAQDIERIVEKILGDEYDGRRQGEGYVIG